MALKRADYRQIAARAVDEWIVGVDLGQSTDPTAICVLNHGVVPLDNWTVNDKARRIKSYKLTPSGKRQLTAEKRVWDRIVTAVTQVLETT